MTDIVIKGLTQNNLKNISFTIPKEKITIFTGVSGSGKSSIVFDTIAAESGRQMNASYPAFIRSRLPKYRKPHVEFIDNLTSSIVVDQAPLGGNARSTVGTISDLYSCLRLLFSRIGRPYVGTASYFSFNDPNGMCQTCSGLGKITNIDIAAIIDLDKSWNEGCIKDSLHKPGSYYWKQYAQAGFFDLDKPVKDYSKEEYLLLLYGTRDGKGAPESPKVTGVYHKYAHIFLNRDISNKSRQTQYKAQNLITEVACADCHGKRLHEAALQCKINGYSIADMCEMELTKLREVLSHISDKNVTLLVQSLSDGIGRMIDIGMPYLHLNRETATLSGGEAGRLKLVRYMGSNLTGMTYIFDEPSIGMHPRNVITVVTGVAGSGKSTLISKVFASQYAHDVVIVNQSPITATTRSTPASYLGFFDEIRKLFARKNEKEEGLFSFNSTSACPICSGKGILVTELAFMDPIVTECEACSGTRYSQEALACSYKGKSIVGILALTASEALELFEDPKIVRHIKGMQQVGLSYLNLGQPLSTLSGGERQRMKLAKNLGKKGNVIVMDEPTTGLHMSDVEKLMALFDLIVSKGNTLVIIEHNLDVIKQADWIIDIGPDGGKDGGEVVFPGTPMDMVKSANTLTADCLRAACPKRD